jgi:D-amino-acid oxidase
MRILILGAGIVGLTSALALLRTGHEVTVYAKAFPPDTTSDRAAAIWWPDLAAAPNSVTSAYRRRIVNWARTAWQRYRELSLDQTYGIRPEKCYIFSAEKPVSPIAAEVVEHSVLRHTPHLPGPLEWTWEFDSLLIEMPRFLPRLFSDFADAGGRYAKVEIPSLKELTHLGNDARADAIVNCTGLGSRDLVGDPLLVPVRGQLILMRPQDVGYKLTCEWQGRSIYWMARSDALILGGSYEVGEESDLTTETEIEAIWRAHQSWIDAGGGNLPTPILRREDIIGYIAGLRPYRRGGVRLEIDSSQQPPIIHNYGHSGCGISLAWGCAEEVATLAASLSTHA